MAILTVSEAAKRCGVSTQTILNWGERGIITIKKEVGKDGRKWFHANKEQIDEICSVAQDIGKTKIELERDAQELNEKRQELNDKIHNIKDELRLVRTLNNTKTINDFILSLVSLLGEIGTIGEREKNILSLLLEGKNIEDISNEFSLSPQRILQLYGRACRKIKNDTRLMDLIDRFDKLTQEYEILKHAFSLLESENKSLKETLGERIENEKKLTLEERRKYLEETDDICKLLSTKVVLASYKDYRGNEKNLSVRALNCLYAANIKTVGDLVTYTKTSLLKLRNFGKKTLWELDDFINYHNLSFGMDVKELYLQRAALHFGLDENNCLG